ncbi:MAG: nickel pincer cofactor biosynthesis protein LarB [Oscillospiraceae bacterium]|jgi:NCAIR mutase (PurE)-related protein
MSLEDLNYAKFDLGREARAGLPEAVFCQGKSPEQIKGIVRHVIESGAKNILATRCSPGDFEVIRSVAPGAKYYDKARIAVVSECIQKYNKGKIAVVTAGTADIPVAEEAAVTAQCYGNRVIRVYDVGVAGIHRLFEHLEEIRSASVVIAVAGMEGALPGIVAGLVSAPVIAVPTSVGYGAGAGGICALLTMVNSCSAGIGVVNIDNGYGAGCLASLINVLGGKEE